jgi:chorismate mutase
MPGLVEEIQRDALNPEVAVSTLLRKVKAAAVKLGLTPVIGWVENELNSYDIKDIPKYRKLRGQPKALNPYHGWIPIIMRTDKENDILAKVDVRQSIASLEDLVSKSTGGFVHFPYPASVIRQLNEHMDVEFGSMSNHLSTTQIHGIIDAVRNAALDWALELEKAGIIGEGFSFDSAEKTRAHSSSVTYNIASIASFNGVLGSSNSVGTLTISNEQINSIRETVQKITEALPELEKAGVDRQALVKAIADIETEANSPKPDGGRLKSMLSSARDILVGAAGNLTAEGAIGMLAFAMKALGG